jgi:hypothetical protein
MTDAIIADLDGDLPSETADLKMLKPGTAELNGWILTMAGPSHPKTLAYREKKQRERLHKEAAIEQAQVNGRKYKADQRTPEEAEIDTMQWVVSRIVTWSPVKVGGQMIEFSDAAATELLRRPTMAAYLQQIIDYLNADRAFMPASARI